MSAPILSLAALCKRFGETVPADDVSLDIERGEFFTMLGPSGSGKSTILRIVAGLEEPDAGRVLIAGRDMTGVPPWRRHLGMVFQQYANFPHMNVAENVAYGLRRSGLDREARRARVRVIFAQPQHSDASARLIAGEIGARVEFLDPMAYAWMENLRESARKIAGALVE